MNKLPVKHGDVYYRSDFFLRDVGVQIYPQLVPLGITPDRILGDFGKDRLPEILDFCKKNPDFHIISFMPGGIILNYPSINARWYCLADGDANPRLVAKDHAGLKMLALVRQRTLSSKSNC